MSMRVTLSIHKTHRQYTAGMEIVAVTGKTVGECLYALVKRFPDMGPVLFDGEGNLNNRIEIYLNMESAYPDEVNKKVKDGDEIYITLMLAGG